MNELEQRRKIAAQLDLQRRMTKAGSSTYLAEKVRSGYMKAGVPAELLKGRGAAWAGKASMIGQTAGAVRTGMSLIDWAKPFMVACLILFLVIGPGLSAVFQIFGAMDWYLWVGAIVIGLLIWRNA